MPDPVAVSTPGGALLVWALIFPAAGALLALVLGGRHAERIVLALIPVGLGLAIAIAAGVLRADAALVYVVGGWAPPLGIALRADGLSAAMMITTAVVIAAVGLFARADFQTPQGCPKRARPWRSGHSYWRSGARSTPFSSVTICSICSSRWSC
jgi:multicomponent Na+:H+ antiporter subunit D